MYCTFHESISSLYLSMWQPHLKDDMQKNAVYGGQRRETLYDIQNKNRIKTTLIKDSPKQRLTKVKEFVTTTGGNISTWSI